MVLVGRCTEHGGATYAPLREVVTAAVGGTTDGLHALMDGEPDGELVAERVADALGASSAPGPVEETAWAIRRLLERLARDRPVVLVLEDVHWAAAGLLDVVEHVVDVGRAPILVVCLARGELLDTRPGWPGGTVNSSSLVLGSLTADEATRLLDELVAGKPLDPGDRARIVGVADGNPLYLEQLLAASGDEAPDGVPDSIQALLAARLDALPWDEREALDAAAVCGVTFSAAAVSELVGREVRRPLDELVRRDLLRPADVPLFGEETLTFGHALIHDASYASVPKRRRAALHQAAAERLARVEAERGLELDELVGFHLERAAQLRADVGEGGAELRLVSREAGPPSPQGGNAGVGARRARRGAVAADAGRRPLRR